MDLYTQRCDIDSGLGAPAFHHRNHELGKRLVLLPRILVRMALGGVHGAGHHISQRAHRLGLRLHQHQHAAHVGVVDDRHGFRPAREFVALHAILRIGKRPLIGTLGNRHALHAHAETGRVHHDEHVRKPFVLFTHDITHGIVEHHHGRGARMDAQLVLDRCAGCGIALPQRPIRLDEELRHDKQRDSLHARGRIGRAGQHEVDDVLGQVMFAVGNEDFLPADPVVIPLAHRFRAQQGKVRAGLRFGQIHRAGPGARHHFLEECFLQPLAAAQQ